MLWEVTTSPAQTVPEVMLTAAADEPIDAHAPGFPEESGAW